MKKGMNAIGVTGRGIGPRGFRGMAREKAVDRF